jgi:putative tryptophan/tyrosine transport system substrate-binding protein
LAAALTEMKVDVIVAGDSSTARAAKQATREIPIVGAAFTDDPVAAGLVSSLGQPGGNVAGLAIFAPEMSGKRLELLRDLVPHLARVGILWTRQRASHPALLRAAKEGHIGSASTR